MPRNPGRSAVVVAAVAQVVLSLWFTRKGGATLPPDGLEYAEVARSLARGAGYTINFVEIHAGLLPTVRHLHELHGLLQPFFVAPLFWIWGPSAALARIPGVLFVGALSLVTFELGELLFGTVPGCIAAALLLARRDLVIDGLSGGDDVGWALFSTLALLFVVRGIESGRRRDLAIAGAAAAATTLQKFSGIAIPLVLAGVLIAVPRARAAVGLRGWMIVSAPVAGAAALYGARNYALHGSIGFRFSALDWLAKDHAWGYFAYFEKPPTVSRVWEIMGASRMLELTLEQFRLLGVVSVEYPTVMIAGPLALVWVWGRSRAFSCFGLLYAAVNVLVVCFAYHVEARYFFALYPIYIVALSAAAVAALRRAGDALPAASLPRARMAAALAGALAFTVAFSRMIGLPQDVGKWMQAEGQCDEAIAFLRTHVAPDEPILTSSPWFVTWATDRPSVNVPTNGEEADLVKVADHYRTEWALDGLPSSGTADVRAALKPLARLESPMFPELVYGGPRCNVYRLHRAK